MLCFLDQSPQLRSLEINFTLVFSFSKHISLKSRLIFGDVLRWIALSRQFATHGKGLFSPAQQHHVCAHTRDKAGQTEVLKDETGGNDALWLLCWQPLFGGCLTACFHPTDVTHQGQL